MTRIANTLSAGFLFGLWINAIPFNGKVFAPHDQILINGLLGLGSVGGIATSFFLRNPLRKVGIWKDIWAAVVVIQTICMGVAMICLYARMRGIELFYWPALIPLSAFGFGLAYFRLSEEPNARGRLI